MECVIDTSSLSWLAGIGHLGLLERVYDLIIAPPGVLTQLKDHYQTKEFIQRKVTPLRFEEEREQRRFYRLSRRWKKKVDIEDIVDAEVFVAYRFFTEANEALYANKDAARRFSAYGRVRDIANLHEIAEKKGLFTREESIQYLHSLLQTKPPYRQKYVTQVLTKLLKP